jgi:thermitase
LPNANIISVAAIDPNNARGSFSHYGQRSVDIGAPGVGIISTVIKGQYAKLDGTSMAAPHVAGAAALVWGRMYASPAQDRTQMTTVRDLIYANARPVPALKSFWGYTAPARIPGGVLDLSFLAQSSGDPPTPPKKLVEFRMKVDPSKLR